jgi:DNA replication protein DnaC
MYMVRLFDWTRYDHYLKQYPEFRTYQGYRFLDTVFLVKMASTSPESHNKRLQTMQQELQVFQDGSYDDAYYSVTFKQGEVLRAKKKMRDWVGKGWIESAHQGLVLEGGYGSGMTYLEGAMTLKPINYQWSPEYQKLADSLGLKLAHSFGDGTYVLRSEEKLIDAAVFFKQLEFAEDTRWRYGNPSFFNPFRTEPVIREFME